MCCQIGLAASANLEVDFLANRWIRSQICLTCIYEKCGGAIKIRLRDQRTQKRIGHWKMVPVLRIDKQHFSLIDFIDCGKHRKVEPDMEIEDGSKNGEIGRRQRLLGVLLDMLIAVGKSEYEGVDRGVRKHPEHVGIQRICCGRDLHVAEGSAPSRS
jgi:hypothetical protein